MLARMLELVNHPDSQVRCRMPSAAELRRTEAMVRAFLGLSGRMRQHFAERVAEFDLTPAQAHLLRELAGGPRPMGELAGQLHCDASNVTGLADRLEQRGLVERRPSPGDRRVKVLVLTHDGEQLQRSLVERLMTDSPLSAGLPARDQVELLRLLQQLEPPRRAGGPSVC